MIAVVRTGVVPLPRRVLVIGVFRGGTVEF